MAAAVMVLVGPAAVAAGRPLLAGVFGVFLVVFCVVKWGICGGMVSAAWASAVMLGAFAAGTAYLTGTELFTAFLTYFALGAGLGRVIEVLRAQQRAMEQTNESLRREKVFAGKVMETLREREKKYRDMAFSMPGRSEIEKMVSHMKVISGVLSCFVETPLERKDEATGQFLRRTGEFFKFDRCRLFMMSKDAATLANTHRWFSDAAGVRSDLAEDIDVRDVPWLMERLQSREPVKIDDVGEMPPAAEAEKSMLERQGVSSLLCFPVVIEDKLKGFFEFGVMGEKGMERSDGDVASLKAVVDIAECALARYESEERFLRLIYHDRLTDVFNRAFFEEEMERLDVKRQQPLSIIVADVRGLKHLNAEMGRDRDDELIVKAAAILRRACRREDILARWSGGEFVILFPQTGSERVEKICERIRRMFAGVEEELVPVSIALGCATKESALQDINEVRKNAKKRMELNKCM